MNKLRDKMAIVGIGESEYVWKSKRGAKADIIDAVQKALKDANISPKEVDGVISDSRFSNLIFQPYELAFNLGFRYRFGNTAAIAGAGNGSIPLIATLAIAAGKADVIVGYCCNEFGTLRRAAWTYGDHDSGVKAQVELPYGIYGAPVCWPLRTQRYMHEFGLTTKQLGAIAVTQRNYAVLNGNGLFKKPITIEDYEEAPTIADPLKIYDYTPMHDGACAWVMTSADRAKDCPHKPVYVMATGLSSYEMTDAGMDIQGPNYINKPSEGLALEQALQEAELTREDLDFAEIYDAYSFMLMTFIESCGFCKVGEGKYFWESGEASLGGSLPINTHGGHLSHSYLFGASHLIEAVRQLRGDAGAAQVKNAKIGAFISGGGGTQGMTTILRT